MISSVIPARLEFSCGHAALVSLPRLKGESAAQRTERVNGEKSGARVRACDFCGPREQALVEVRAVQPVASTSAPRNGHPTRDEPLVMAHRIETPVMTPLHQPQPPVRAVRPVKPPVQLAPPNSAPPAVMAPVVAAPPRRRKASSSPVAAGRPLQFQVRFAAETVIHASDIRAALRQLESLGATDVLSIALTHA